VEQGDEVIVPDPGYAIYGSAATLAGGTPVGIPLRERNDFRLDIEELKSKITPKTKLLVINSPQNPTGGVLSTRDLEQIAEHAMVGEFKRRRDLVVDRLNALPGVSCHKPLGAFYVFPNITQTGLDERVLADRMLNEGGVALLAGSTFGPSGKGYLRLSYANS